MCQNFKLELILMLNLAPRTKRRKYTFTAYTRKPFISATRQQIEIGDIKNKRR